MSRSAKWTSLAAAAAAAAVLAETIGIRPVTILAAAVAFFSAVMALLSRYLDDVDERSERDRRRRAERDIRDIRDLAEATHANTEEIKRELSRAIAAGAEPSGLQIKALELANDIAHFFEQRIEKFLQQETQREWIPTGPVPSPFDFYDRETVRLYWDRFGDPVAELRDEIAGSMKIRDPELDAAFRHAPSSNREIHKVINGLKGLAETIGGD